MVNSIYWLIIMIKQTNTNRTQETWILKTDLEDNAQQIFGIPFIQSSGRPPIFNTPEEMQEKIYNYFQSEASKKVIVTKDWSRLQVPHPTITWLALYIGFADRSSFYNYEEKEEFSYTIKRARSFIENEYEKMLASNPTWAIFALKNFWWKDTQTFEGEMTNNNRSVVVEYKPWKYENLWEDGEPIK